MTDDLKAPAARFLYHWHLHNKLQADNGPDTEQPEIDQYCNSCLYNLLYRRYWILYSYRNFQEQTSTGCYWDQLNSCSVLLMRKLLHRRNSPEK